MNQDPLITYLQDHLAGARAAVELLAYLRREDPEPEVRRFATDLLAEVESDREVVVEFVHARGANESFLKDAAAWLGEKLSRLKLSRHARADRAFALFEALEALSLGILGKRALWRALKAATEAGTWSAGPDFGQLERRALEQYERVEQRRLDLARQIFAGAGAAG